MRDPEVRLPDDLELGPRAKTAGNSYWDESERTWLDGIVVAVDEADMGSPESARGCKPVVTA